MPKIPLFCHFVQFFVPCATDVQCYSGLRRTDDSPPTSYIKTPDTGGPLTLTTFFPHRNIGRVAKLYIFTLSLHW